LAASGLARWLSENPQGQLNLVGSVALPRDLVPFGPQIRQLPELPFPEYLRELSRSTIALAPLTSDAFNLYKSHIRYLESGLVGTPLIGSPTLYAKYIDDGRTGLIANDGDWFAAISRLAADPDMQRRMAQEARDHVREWELDQRPLDQTRKLLHSLVPEWAGP
jgi:glycosyltransferase involved in cell wall biosynthesis